MFNELQADKFIVFKIAGYSMALAINDVLSVVHCSSVVKKTLTKIGLVVLGSRTMRLLDLDRYLGVETPQPLVPTTTTVPIRSQDNPNQSFFLVITRDQQGKLWGISVDEPPDLVEIPHQMMRPLPKYYRQGYNRQSNEILDLVNHVAIVSQEDISTTIFILDIQPVIATLMTEIHPRGQLSRR